MRHEQRQAVHVGAEMPKPARRHFTSFSVHGCRFSAVFHRRKLRHSASLAPTFFFSVVARHVPGNRMFEESIHAFMFCCLRADVLSKT